MNFPWGRRRFVGALLKASAVAAVARAIPWSRTAAAAEAPAPFTGHEQDTLRRLSFLLFPYPDLGTAAYQRVVTAVTAAVGRDASVRSLVRDGIGLLDGMQAAPFLSLDEAAQVSALKRIEASPFFRYVLQATRDDLFNNPALWSRIGYEGSSLEFGGYLERGLNDIDWLDGE